TGEQGKIPEKKKSPSDLPAYFSSTTHRWAHLTIPWLIPTLSTFPLKRKWTSVVNNGLTHQRTYADDYLVQRVAQCNCYLVATGPGHLHEESGISLESLSCTFLNIGTTSSKCHMIVEPFSSNSYKTKISGFI
ncbi:hypothetical protein HPG69_010175, partial [Diceros bicornis minor]